MESSSVFSYFEIFLQDIAHIYSLSKYTTAQNAMVRFVAARVNLAFEASAVIRSKMLPTSQVRKTLVAQS